MILAEIKPDGKYLLLIQDNLSRDHLNHLREIMNENGYENVKMIAGRGVKMHDVYFGLYCSHCKTWASNSLGEFIHYPSAAIAQAHCDQRNAEIHSREWKTPHQWSAVQYGTEGIIFNEGELEFKNEVPNL